MNIFTVDSFGADLPKNWEAILEFLNTICENYHFENHEYAELWEHFWEELGYDAGNFDIIDHEVLEGRLVQ